jgi:hypothetical protein
MRQGYRVYDADAHFSATAESLEPYLGPELHARVPDLDQHKVPLMIGWPAEKLEPPYRHMFRLGGRAGGWRSTNTRWLGEAAPRADAEHEFQRFCCRALGSPHEGAAS